MRLSDEIRPATRDDIPALIELGRAMHAESPRFSRHPYSPAKTAGTIDFLLANGAVFVAVKGGQAVGMMGGMVAPGWFTDEATAIELAVYVTPEHRGLIGARLIRTYEAWAFAHGAAEVVLGITTGIHTERTAAFYERLGYQRAGITTVKRREH